MSDTYLSGGLIALLWNRIKNLIATKENKFTVLPIDKGGTGGSTSDEAMTNLIGSLPQFSGSYHVSDMHYPVYCAPDESDSDTYPERIGYQSLTDFYNVINNRNNKVSSANTSYTTYMARGIAITSSIPSSMINGTAVFIY